MQRHQLHEKLGYREYLTLTLPDNTVLLHQVTNLTLTLPNNTMLLHHHAPAH
jgi:hypothetical protein